MYSGRTYTLTNTSGDSSDYYQLISDLADRCLEVVPCEKDLVMRIRDASGWYAKITGNLRSRSDVKRIVKILEEDLSPFLTGIEEHLSRLSLTDRLNRTMRMRKTGYFLSMLEIELTNRINAPLFGRSSWKMALIAHCLRDFRGNCRSLHGEVEECCTGCTEECFLNLGSRLAERFGVVPYISVSMDHKRLFKTLKGKHPGMSALGIACVPELVTGLRLCERFGIPAVGVPLDANRCSRWFGQSLETTFNLEEMEKLLNAVPGS